MVHWRDKDSAQAQIRKTEGEKPEQGIHEYHISEFHRIASRVTAIEDDRHRAALPTTRRTVETLPESVDSPALGIRPDCRDYIAALRGIASRYPHGWLPIYPCYRCHNASARLL